MDISEMASALAAQRKQVAHDCLKCGTKFVGIAKARYCSHACRQEQYRQRTRLAESSTPYSVTSSSVKPAVREWSD